MQMALDLEGIDRSVYKGTSMWQPQGIIGEGVGEYFTPFDEWPEEVKKGYMYDPAGAEALLDEAGYPRGADGTRFKTVLNHLYRFDLGYSELAATYWADIGVQVEINVLDAASAGPARKDRTWEGLIFHILGNNADPMPTVRSHVRSDGSNASHGISYPELDALLDAAGATTSIEEQQSLVKEVDMYTMENHWWIWGPKPGKYMAHQPWVVGFNGETWLGAMDRLTIFSRLWIDQDLKKEMGH
jgi:peptide/nickel transport system substrate-binding protein